MSRCKIVASLVSDGPPYLAAPLGASRAVVRCETHGMPFDGPGPVGAGDLCPLGKIEAAVEEGLARIRAASTAATAAQTDTCGTDCALANGPCGRANCPWGPPSHG